MDLSLSDEQQALVGSFADLLRKHASIERVRAAEPGGLRPGAVGRAARRSASSRWPCREAGGGWGAGLLDLALVAEQVGRDRGARRRSSRPRWRPASWPTRR